MKKLLMLIVLLLLSSTVSSAQQELPEFNPEILSVTISSDQNFSYAYTAEWGMNGELIAVGTLRGLFIYNSSLELLAILYSGKEISSISWRAQTNQFAITVDRSIEIWQFNPITNELQLIKVISFDGYTTIVSYNPSGNYLVTFIADETNRGINNRLPNFIRFYDTNTWQMVSQVTDWVYAVDFAKRNHSNCDWRSDGLVMACFGVVADAISRVNSDPKYNRKMVHLFDPQTGALLKSIPSRGVAQDIAISWRPNSSLVALGNDVGIGIYDVDAPETDAFITSLGGPFLFFITNVDWSPDGRYLVSQGIVTDYESGQLIGNYDPNGNNRSALLSRWNPFKNQILTLYENATTFFSELSINDVHLMPGIALTLMPTATPFSVPTPKP